MKTAILVARLVLGLIFLVFGLNGFFRFIPLPPPAPGPAADYLTVMVTSGYLLYLVKAVEVIAGVCLLARIQVPLTLIVLFPITVNIFLFHLFLLPEGSWMAILILVLHLFLAYAHRAKYTPLLRESGE